MSPLKPAEVQYLIWQLTQEGAYEVAMLLAFDHSTNNEEDMTDE